MKSSQDTFQGVKYLSCFALRFSCRRISHLVSTGNKYSRITIVVLIYLIKRKYFIDFISYIHIKCTLKFEIKAYKNKLKVLI